MAEELRRNCELCDEEAAVYCPCDTAFLCDACDDKVHRANFLVARHVRVELCRVCHKFAGKRFSGVGTSSPSKIPGRACASCSPELEKVIIADNGVDNDDNDRVSSTSSSCVSCTSSSASSRRRRRRSAGASTAAVVAVDAKVEGILVIWCRKMNINEENNNSGVVREVVEVLSKCLGKMTILPFRVLLAGAFWAVIRTREGSELTRLEQISGVPRQLILATESRLARVVKRRQSRVDHEEGWAES